MDEGSNLMRWRGGDFTSGIPVCLLARERVWKPSVISADNRAKQIGVVGCCWALIVEWRREIPRRVGAASRRMTSRWRGMFVLL